MSEMLQQIKKAQTDNLELSLMIRAYMPFIRKEVARTPVFQMEYDDRLSFAMIVFMNCVRQYDEETGGFLAFVSVCIRNRLIDEGKKISRYTTRTIPFAAREESEENCFENTRSVLEYDRDRERLSLVEEIDSLAESLQEYGITLNNLSRICPKQKRSRKQCALLAREVVSDPVLKENFFKTRRLPQSELASRFGLSEKTVEKHRRYIVALVLIITGEFPGIRAYLPKGTDQSENWNDIEN
jgi:RNA polymerase sigma factor